MKTTTKQKKIKEIRRKIKCHCGKIMKRIGPYNYQCLKHPRLGVLIA